LILGATAQQFSRLEGRRFVPAHTRASIASIDLRALSLSNTWTYRRRASTCARWPKHSFERREPRHPPTQLIDRVAIVHRAAAYRIPARKSAEPDSLELSDQTSTGAGPERELIRGCSIVTDTSGHAEPLNPMAARPCQAIPAQRRKRGRTMQSRDVSQEPNVDPRRFDVDTAAR
jgi:hypothetical protein